MRHHSGMVLIPLCAVALAVSIVAVFIRLALANAHVHLYNADLLYLSSLFADIAGGGRISDWQFTNAPYFFPDVVLFLPFWLLVPNMFTAIALFGAMQLLVLSGGFAWLAVRATNSSLAGAVALLCGTVFCVAVATPGTEYNLAITQVFHVGLLMVMPFAILIAGELLVAEGRRQRTWLMILLAMLNALTIGSDPLYLFQVVLPMLGGCMVLAWTRHVTWAVAARGITVIAFSSVVGLSVERLTQPYRAPIEAGFSVNAAHTAFEQLITALPRMLYPWPWMGVTLLVFMICASGVVLHGIRRSPPRGQAEIIRLLALGTILAGLVLMPMVAVLTAKPIGRYMLNVLYIGPFFAWPLLIPPTLVPQLQRALKVAAASGALILLLHAALPLPKITALTAYRDYYPSFVACLDAHVDRYDLHSGIAQYWQARPISMLSQRNLKAVSVRQDLSVWHRMNSIAWYKRDVDFAVVDHSPSGNIFGFSAETLTKRFGQPTAIFRCEDSEVYVYNRPEDIAFRSAMRRQVLYLDFRNQPDHAVSILGSEFTGRVGTSSGEVRVATAAEKGYIVMSDWLQFDSGRYVLEIDYDTDLVVNPGFVELSGRSREGEIELTGGGLGLALGSRQAQFQFATNEPTGVQIQLYTNGNGRFELQEIRIRRMP